MDEPTPRLPLVIREEQQRVLGDDLLKRWLTRYLAGCYPERLRSIGRMDLDGFLAGSIAKARSHRCSEPEEIRKFVHVAFLAGVDFDLLPWARRILSSRFYRQPLARARALEDAAVAELARRDDRGLA